MIRRILPILVLAILISACGSETPSSQNSNNSAAPVASAANVATSLTANPNMETLLVGSEVLYEPFEFKDEHGQPQGFEIEMMTEIAKAAGMNIQVIDVPRNTAETTLNSNKYQVFISAMSRSPERLEKLDMGEPYLEYEHALYVLDTPENANLRTIEDFKGKNIAAHKGSSGNIAKIKEWEANPVLSDSFFLSLKNTSADKADATLGDSRVMQYYLTKNPGVKARLIMIRDGKTGISFAVKKGNTTLLNKLNDGLAKIKANGTFDALIIKWFGSKE
ncbi:substrate-binding periplasmic protein [Kingella kingae]|uniref:substrate-binding periplasmic protein n=1 Tax=Kingella kingae TaxID=504 RepID=UPI00254EB965|nr:transporter substrate-binding domain-containing protein [Kingella kingae]MDK4611241.1 transporter substrate-binding domain-containing protein [Kingella kingae]